MLSFRMNLLFCCFIYSLFCGAMENDKSLQSYTMLHSMGELRGLEFLNNRTILVVGPKQMTTLCLDKKQQDVVLNFHQDLCDFAVSGKKIVAAAKDQLILFDRQNNDILTNIYTLQDPSGIPVCDNKRIIFTPHTNKIMMAITSSFYTTIAKIDYSDANIYHRIGKYKNDYGICASFAVNPQTKDVLILNAQISDNSESGLNNVHKIIKFDDQDNCYNVEKEIKSAELALSGLFSPDGKILAINTKDHGCRLYDVNDYQLYLTIDPYSHDKLFSCYSDIAFHPFKFIIALLRSGNNTVELWNYVKNHSKLREPLCIIRLDSKGAFFRWIDSNKYIKFSPDGKCIAALNNNDNQIHVVPVPENIAHVPDIS